MPAVSASAPGKVILFGEHAVVYGQPAIAVPVNQVSSHAVILANPAGLPDQIHLIAPQINIDQDLDALPEDHPLAIAVMQVKRQLKLGHLPSCTLQLNSTVPMSSGLGSSASTAVAVIRALGLFLGQPFTEEEVSQLAYAVEKKQHGNPSGIDNTVIAYNRPVYFIRNQPMLPLKVALPFTLIVANSGISSSTADVVAAVRAAWEKETAHYDRLFTSIGNISTQARSLIEHGPIMKLGHLMSANHTLLQEMGVSCPELDRLVAAALEAGALGAKLCGAGWGGNMVALTPEDKTQDIQAALKYAGATQTFIAEILASGRN